jgi:hypothetical protein
MTFLKTALFAAALQQHRETHEMVAEEVNQSGKQDTIKKTD